VGGGWARRSQAGKKIKKEVDRRIWPDSMGFYNNLERII